MALDEQEAGLNRVSGAENDGSVDVAISQVTQKADEQARLAMEDLQKQILEAQKREKERNEQLAKVIIDKNDVQLLAKEFMIASNVAEKLLREHGGDFKRAARFLIYEP